MFMMEKIFLMVKKVLPLDSWGSNKKTLSEEEINKEANLIISGMKKKLNAILR